MIPKFHSIFAESDLASAFILLTVMALCMRKHLVSPLASFINSWTLRISFSLFSAFFANSISDVRMPISLLFATALLAVFLFESIKMWMLSGTFAQVDVPIFPRFRRSPESFAWPIGNFFDDARNSILAQGFTEKALLKMGFNQYFAIYSPVFLSKDQCSRLQIIFNSLRLGRPFLSCVLTSFASDGTPIVTNNLRAICASFYPKSWDVKRRSMVSIEKLLKTHASRIAGKELLKIDETNLLETINSENHQIELLNCDAGLCEKLRWNNNITLTFHGRYVLWCDLLTYSYFGK